MADDFKARPYQQLLIEHMLDKERCAGFAFMGAGKTVSTASMLEVLYSFGEEKTPTLILGPLRVAKNVWPSEFKKWEHLQHMRVVPIVGTETERRHALKQKAQIFTMNYENLPWLTEYLKDEWPFGIVVADESTRLKSFRIKQGGKQAAALGKVAHRKVHRFINLTGTPAPNGLQDLWAPCWFLDAGHRLGRSYKAFTDRWFQSLPGEPGRQRIKPLPFAQSQIQDVIKDLCLTLDAKDWFPVEDPIVRDICVELPPAARSLYREMQKQMFFELEGANVSASNAASKTCKCLQIGNGAVYIDPTADSDFHPKAKEWKQIHDIKIDALRSIIEEASGAPILVAYHFRSDLARLLKAFPQGRHLDDKQETEDAWNRSEIPILFAHPASAGHGLNLQYGGNILVYFGHWWNLEQRQQILERIGPVRQLQAGFKRPVFVYNIIASGTVDEMVLDCINNKREVQDVLLEAMKRLK